MVWCRPKYGGGGFFVCRISEKMCIFAAVFSNDGKAYDRKRTV